MSNYANNPTGTMPDFSQQQMLCQAQVAKHFDTPPPEDTGAELLGICLVLCTVVVGSTVGVGLGAGVAVLPAPVLYGALGAGGGDVVAQEQSKGVSNIDWREVAFMAALGGGTGGLTPPGLRPLVRFGVGAATGYGGSAGWSAVSGQGTGDPAANGRAGLTGGFCALIKDPRAAALCATVTGLMGK